jgi:sulfoxide reductase heme-binding subunit YedZ
MALRLTLASLQLGGPTMWYLTRAAAVSAYVLLTLTVLLGLFQSLARTSRERITWIVDDLHRFIASLMLVMTAGHLLTLWLDPFLPFSIANFFIPANEPYRPVAVNLGVFGVYAMVCILISSWMRQQIPHRFWRAIHYLSFVMFVLVTLHGIMAGSDAGEPWMRAIYAGASTSVIFLVFLRLVIRPSPAASAG